ncbi:hypothetical protein NK718_02285 [Alsobacter sp. SYSU M60028]|uniref:Magnesium transporter MgtE intracellular domain-containing protein n=1 Tax=Alsobacter ponti TaxID=2962936 RepID=A0ABT1L797_9HYPH|nr:hypothetical protein [Alsobacter ponti]MCP8937332.1 hypothetical protein [Alsobacter ponti]
MKANAVRLFPAVAGAAAALLLLKVGEIAFAPRQHTTLDQTISRVFVDARGAGAPAVDPETTGSTASAPAPPKEEPKAPPVGTPVDPSKPAVSPAQRGLLERLGERREQMEQRQRELDLREEALKAADKRLEQRLNELREIETKGTAAKSEPDASLRSLVTMYETMKPKEAARVFEKLELPVLVPVVTAMNARKMAEVLAAMSPESASRLTVELAKGAARPPAPSPVAGAALPPGELQAIEPVKPVAEQR